jgi:molybdate transport system regulatory protein
MNNLKLGSTIWIDSDEHPLLGKGRIELLKRIEELGSLSKAAKSMGMSYKAAWDTIKSMNDAAPEPLTHAATGGKNGGGCVVSSAGSAYIRLYEAIFREQQQFFDSIQKHLANEKNFERFIARTSLRTSARNQLHAPVLSIAKLGMSSEVALDIGESEPLIALITTKSVSELALKKDLYIYALIKSSWVRIADDEANGGENSFRARVISVDTKEQQRETHLALAGGTTLVSSHAGRELNVGDEVTISIEKRNIILGV